MHTLADGATGSPEGGSARRDGATRRETPARIGPNAVTQLAAALGARAAPVFAAAGRSAWLECPPEAMLEEAPVARLHQALRAALPADEAALLLAEAGRRTADYLLAHRIPRPAQRVLRALPPRPAAWLLLRAIRAHAWTFAGSGRFAARAGNPTVVTLHANPFCAREHALHPVCAWHAAVFQRLFHALVSPGACAVETRCCAQGDASCRFELRW